MEPEPRAELGRVQPFGRALELGEDPGPRVGVGGAQWLIVPFGFPTFSSPTWPRSTCAKAWETNG